MKSGIPSRVANIETFWLEKPDVISERCIYWEQKMKSDGWRPNRRILGFGYYEAAKFFGVYIWEYINIISPLLHDARRD